MFIRLEVIVLTNKQTDRQTPLKTSNALRYAKTRDLDTATQGLLTSRLTKRK